MSSDLKEIAVLDASELGEGQMKTVPFGDGKVLLSKIKGEVYATSAVCTHYGAPLEKGVLSHDGRVVCPWHGACFNVCTGDIEDSPGLDSLWKFAAKVNSEGKIVVSASEKEIKSKIGRIVPKARTSKKTESKETVVIVGGGSGGLQTVESLRMNDFQGDIILISEEPYAPIDRTKMSKGLVDDAEKLQWRTPSELKDDFGVEFLSGTSVSEVDTAAQTVTVSTGTTISYDHLVLSPGAKAKKIPIPGHDLHGVQTLRTVKDTKAITSAISKESDIVIIGTSFIGMELAGAIIKKEPKSLTLVGMDEIPFEAILGKEIGSAIMEDMKKQGIKFIMKAGVEKILPADSNPSHCGSVTLKGQPALPANLIIMGTGVAPATDFLKGSSIPLEKDGGVTVDSYLRVKSGAKNVYAIGDIAHYPQYPEKKDRRVEHWNVAGNQGREVGHTIAKPNEPIAYTKVPIFWSSIGKGLRYLGTGAGFDDTYTDGNVGELKFASYQSKEGKITAVATMGRDPIVAKASELMRLDIMPSMADIRNGKDILEVDLISAAA
ncbi:apoptosis-inducing factor 3, partial [Tremellales sp. Uapishka_1]